MASWFNLELDTTPPHIDINIPNRSIPQNVIEIIITSNEVLSAYQDISIVDAANVTRYYTFFASNENTLMGYVDLQNYEIGMATIYVRLKDEVLNLSDVRSASINIGYLTEEIYEAHTSLLRRDLNLTESCRLLKTVLSERNCISSEIVRNIDINVKTRVIETEVTA